MDTPVLQELRQLRGVVKRAIDRADGILKRDDSFAVGSIRDVLQAQHTRIGNLIEPEV
jgi:hypothetical protein